MCRRELTSRRPQDCKVAFEKRVHPSMRVCVSATRPVKLCYRLAVNPRCAAPPLMTHCKLEILAFILRTSQEIAAIGYCQNQALHTSEISTDEKTLMAGQTAEKRWKTFNTIITMPQNDRSGQLGIIVSDSTVRRPGNPGSDQTAQPAPSAFIPLKL